MLEPVPTTASFLVGLHSLPDPQVRYPATTRPVAGMQIPDRPATCRPE